MKKYYVIYQSKDIGYYETVRSVMCVVEDEEIAKDFCNKFKLNYIETTVGSGNLLIACLIAGADSDKIFGNEYDADIIPTCRNRINRACDLLGKPRIKDWQIHQGNALHRFAITYFGEDYEEMYFDGKVQPAARKRKLEDSSYDAYTMSTRFKQKYPELYEEELSVNLNTIQKKQAEATGSFDLFGGLF